MEYHKLKAQTQEDKDVNNTEDKLIYKIQCSPQVGAQRS